MNRELHPNILDNISTSNARDVEAIPACFRDAATVRDENETRRGKQAIKGCNFTVKRQH